MRSMSGHERWLGGISANRAGRWAVLLAGMALVLHSFASGCTEFSHFGQISDWESTRAIYGVVISQHQPDGGWKRVGETDGTGRWNIFKRRISGGGDIRLSKPGYRTKTMLESTFLQEHNILMQATGENSYDRMP